MTQAYAFWAHTLHFPPDFSTNQHAPLYNNALQQICLGIRDEGCYNKEHFIYVACFFSVTGSIQWLQSYHLPPTWLQHPLPQTLKAMRAPSIEQLQRWNFPLLQLPPVPQRITAKRPAFHWLFPHHNAFQLSLLSFPHSRVFGSHINAQLKTAFFNTISQPQRVRGI